MIILQDVLDSLNKIAPLATAESWDNVGLLVGDRSRQVERAMTCLTITETTLVEAIEGRADLIVTHHPIPFKPLSRITADSVTGKLLLQAIEHRIAIYSPHTAWDNSECGINAQIAKRLDLRNVTPLAPFANESRDGSNTGAGRLGTLAEPMPIESLRRILKESIPDCQFRHTHSPERSVRKIGIICGSGGSMLSLAINAGCDTMLTGEATYHQCLEAEASNIALVMIGHFASEAFAMTELATKLSQIHPEIVSWASKRESSTF